MDQHLREQIIQRDGGGCVARFVNNRLYAREFPMLQGLPEPGPCKTAGGDVRSPFDQRNLTIEEIKVDKPGSIGSWRGLSIKGGYSLETSIAACWGHHVFGQQWTTKAVVREAFREYLPVANARYRPRFLEE